MLFGHLLSGDHLATSYLACLINNYDELIDRDQILRVSEGAEFRQLVGAAQSRSYHGIANFRGIRGMRSNSPPTRQAVF